MRLVACQKHRCFFPVVLYNVFVLNVFQSMLHTRPLFYMLTFGDSYVYRPQVNY